MAALAQPVPLPAAAPSAPPPTAPARPPPGKTHREGAARRKPTDTTSPATALIGLAASMPPPIPPPVPLAPPAGCAPLSVSPASRVTSDAKPTTAPAIGPATDPNRSALRQPERGPVAAAIPAAPHDPAPSGPVPFAAPASPATPVTASVSAPPTVTATAPPARPSPAPTAPSAPTTQLAPAVVSLLARPSGQSQLTLRLAPPELGQVRIDLHRAPGAPPLVEIRVEKPETLGLLVHSQPQLHQALDQAGVPAAGRSLSFSLDGGGGRQARGGGRGAPARAAPTPDAADPGAPAVTVRLPARAAGLDITA